MSLKTSKMSDENKGNTNISNAVDRVAYRDRGREVCPIVFLPDGAHQPTNYPTCLDPTLRFQNTLHLGQVMV